MATKTITAKDFPDMGYTPRWKAIWREARVRGGADGSDDIKTHHVLRGLLKADWDGISGHALRNLGVSYDGLTFQIICRWPHEGKPTVGVFPHTPEVKRLVERARVLAGKFRHNWIGPEHMLMALSELPDMDKLGMPSAGVVRSEVLRLIAIEPRDLDEEWAEQAKETKRSWREYEKRKRAGSRGPMRHELKTWPPYFEEVHSGRKTFELRKDDRDFRVGDTLHLREWEPVHRIYTGRECERLVTFLLGSKEFPVVAPGYVMMSIAVSWPKTTEDNGL